MIEICIQWNAVRRSAVGTLNYRRCNVGEQQRRHQLFCCCEKRLKNYIGFSQKVETKFFALRFSSNRDFKTVRKISMFNFRKIYSRFANRSLRNMLDSIRSTLVDKLSNIAIKATQTIVFHVKALNEVFQIFPQLSRKISLQSHSAFMVNKTKTKISWLRLSRMNFLRVYTVQYREAAKWNKTVERK